MAAGALGHLDEFPAFVQGDGRGHFDRVVLPRLHGRHRHAHVPAPGRGQVHEVEVVALHELLVAELAAAVVLGPRGRLAFLAEGPGFRGVGRDEVADRPHVHFLDAQEVVQKGQAPASAAHEADAHDVASLEGHAPHPLGREGGLGRSLTGAGGRLPSRPEARQADPRRRGGRGSEQAAARHMTCAHKASFEWMRRIRQPRAVLGSDHSRGRGSHGRRRPLGGAKLTSSAAVKSARRLFGF